MFISGSRNARCIPDHSILFFLVRKSKSQKNQTVAWQRQCPQTGWVRTRRTANIEKGKGRVQDLTRSEQGEQ